MTKEELITKQQLEIEELKSKITEHKTDMQAIYNTLFCVGGLLNDRSYGMDKEQLTMLHSIGDLAKYHLDNNEEES